MIICGIDQSFTCTAIVFLDLKTLEIVDLGYIKTPKKKEGGDLSIAERILNIENYIFEKMKENSCEYAFLEALSLGNRNSVSARNLAGLYYRLLTTFMQNSIPCNSFPPTVVKKFAGGGRLEKKEMFETLPENVREKLLETKAKPTTGLYDLTDAYYIARIGAEKIKKEFQS